MGLATLELVDQRVHEPRRLWRPVPTQCHLAVICELERPELAQRCSTPTNRATSEAFASLSATWSTTRTAFGRPIAART